jgi:hypothetical protein
VWVEARAWLLPWLSVRLSEKAQGEWRAENTKSRHRCIFPK